MKCFSLVLLILTSTLNASAHSDSEANRILRRETLRLAVQNDGQPRQDDQANPNNAKPRVDWRGRDVYFSIGIGPAFQAYDLFDALRKTNRGRSERVAFGTIATANAVIVIYFFGVFAAFDVFFDWWHPDNPSSVGALQTGAATSLVLPTALGHRIGASPLQRSDIFGFAGFGAAGIGAFLFGHRAIQNLSTDVETAQHVQLSPGQFEEKDFNLARSAVFDERAYMLGVHSPRDIAALKEHMMENPDWIESLPYLENADGEQIVSDRKIENLRALREIAREETSKWKEDDFKEGPQSPEEFLKQERLVHSTLIQNEIKRLKQKKGNEDSILRAQKALNRAELLSGAI